MPDIQTSLVAVPCDMCGSEERDLLLRVNRIKGDENRDLVKCRKCGLIYVSPRKLQQYEDMGEESYLDAVKDMVAFARFYDILSTWAHPPGEFLDVGCGAGYLLNIARAHGWKTVGVDLWRSLVHVGQRYMKLDIRQGTIFDAHFDDNSFDVVSMTELIEHVPSPSKVLQEAYRILVDGGILFLTTPNIDSSSFKKLGENWTPSIEPFGHLYYFSPETLKNMLSKEGFEIRDIFAVGGKGLDEQLIAIAGKVKSAKSEQQMNAAALARMRAGRYYRLIHHWFFGLFIRMGDHLINYPPEAKKMLKMGIFEKRYNRLEAHWFFGPIVKLGNYLVNRKKEISNWSK